MAANRRSLLALLVGLALLLGQQAAWSHLASHLGGQSAPSLAPVDTSHGAGGGLVEMCGACLAFAGLDAGPSSQARIPAARGEVARPVVVVPAFGGETRSLSFLARAPPVVS